MAGSSEAPYMRSESDERTVNNDVRHQYRVLTPAEKLAMVRLKDHGAFFLDLIDQDVPKGREASIAKDQDRGSRDVGGQGAHRIGGNDGDATEAETKARARA
jgi:hypothetical protein